LFNIGKPEVKDLQPTSKNKMKTFRNSKTLKLNEDLNTKKIIQRKIFKFPDKLMTDIIYNSNFISKSPTEKNKVLSSDKYLKNNFYSIENNHLDFGNNQ